MNRIRELREEKNISQVRLSIELEVSQETISAYELDKHYPSIKSLIKLRNIFDVNIDYILGLTDTRYSSIQQNTLREDELTVIHMYRKMDGTGRERVKAYMEGYLAALSK